MKLVKNLTFWVFLAILAGIFLGHFHPKEAMSMEILGKSFINVIKCFIYPIIFLTVVLGISSMDDLKKAGRIGFKALIYFEVITTFALGIGVLVALVVQPGKIDRAQIKVADLGTYLAKGSGIDWFKFLADNKTLQVLIIAVIAGIILNYSNKKGAITGALNKLSKFVFRLLHYVMYLAPLAAFGGMAFTVGKFGLKTLVPLAKLVGSIYLTMSIFVLVILGAILSYYKLSIFKFLRYIKEEILLVLGTSSSEPALPALMEKLEKAGCSKSTVGLVVPTGYSFNLDGTSIYLSMAVLFLAQLYGVHLSAGEIASTIGILMITSKGAAGVTGSGFIVLASTLTALHNIPVEGLAFLLGVDKFMSEARAITNLIGNGAATLLIAKSEGEMVAIP